MRVKLPEERGLIAKLKKQRLAKGLLLHDYAPTANRNLRGHSTNQRSNARQPGVD